MKPCDTKISNELHALIAEFKAFRELMAERDKRYDGQFLAAREAVQTALSAQKESTKDAFNSSEKAIVKAEEAQKSYNTSHNDLARKMDDQNKATMPRAETESRFMSMEEKITMLRTAGANTRLLIGLAIAILIGIVGIYLKGAP